MCHLSSEFAGCTPKPATWDGVSLSPSSGSKRPLKRSWAPLHSLCLRTTRPPFSEDREGLAPQVLWLAYGTYASLRHPFLLTLGNAAPPPTLSLAHPLSSSPPLIT